VRTRTGVSLTIKLTAMILTVSMALGETGAAQQIISVPEDFPRQVLDEKALKAKAEVTTRGVGEKSKVRVKLRDKHELKGHITQIDEYSFQLQVEPDWLDDLKPAKGALLRISYNEVEKIAGAKSRPAKVATRVGTVFAVVGAVVLLAALVVLKADRCRRGPC
jgi:hypothetical protein